MSESEMTDWVREFHRAFGVPVADVLTPEPETRELRIELLREEFEEYVAAARAGDAVDVADALADMLYVIHGTALTYGIPIDAVVAEVHRSNMSKLGADGQPVYRADGKVIKGPGFIPPAIGDVLASVPAEAAKRKQRLAAYAVLRRSDDGVDQVLLTRISTRGHHAGVWTLPGGGVDFGEDPRRSVAREITEETGLAATVGALLDCHTVRLTGRSPAGRLEDFHGVSLIYAASADEPGAELRVIEIDGTTDAAAWVPVAEVHAGDRPVFDGVRAGLAADRRRATRDRDS